MLNNESFTGLWPPLQYRTCIAASGVALAEDLAEISRGQQHEYLFGLVLRLQLDANIPLRGRKRRFIPVSIAFDEHPFTGTNASATSCFHPSAQDPLCSKDGVTNPPKRCCVSPILHPTTPR